MLTHNEQQQNKTTIARPFESLRWPSHRKINSIHTFSGIPLLLSPTWSCLPVWILCHLQQNSLFFSFKQWKCELTLTEIYCISLHQFNHICMNLMQLVYLLQNHGIHIPNQGLRCSGIFLVSSATQKILLPQSSSRVQHLRQIVECSGGRFPQKRPLGRGNGCQWCTHRHQRSTWIPGISIQGHTL